DDLTVTALGIPTTTAQASQDVVVGRFRIDSASTGTIGIDQVTLVGTGSGNDAMCADIVSVTLSDEATATTLGTGAYSEDNGTITCTLAAPLNVPASGSITLVVTYDIADSAIDGNTLQVALAGLQPTSAATIGGLPAQGPGLTISNSTPPTLRATATILADRDVAAGSADELVINVGLDALNGIFQLQSLTIGVSGTITPDTQITGISLWRDMDGNGRIDAATDVQLDAGTLSADGTVTFSGASVTVYTGIVTRLLVSASFASGTPVGTRATFTLSGITPTSGSPVQLGLPASGATLTVAPAGGACDDHNNGGCSAGTGSDCSLALLGLLALLALVALRRR
ncbi:MAG: hypothetical protein AB7S36_22395, partial [Planctomycetota bacterium]